MRRTIHILLALGVAATLLPVSAAPAAAGPACRKPEPKVTYDHNIMGVSLAVDLKGCKWWRGHFIDLYGELTRASFPQDGMGVAFSCPQEGYGMRKPRRATFCKIGVELDHLPVEASAVYEGVFEYPWRGGFHELHFRYVCTTVPSPSCTEA